MKYLFRNIFSTVTPLSSSPPPLFLLPDCDPYFSVSSLQFKMATANVQEYSSGSEYGDSEDDFVLDDLVPLVKHVQRDAERLEEEERGANGGEEEEEEEFDFEGFDLAPGEYREPTDPKMILWRELLDAYSQGVVTWLTDFEDPPRKGPLFDGEDLEPFQVFSRVMTDEVYELLVEETNSLARKTLAETTLKPFSIMKNWKDVDLVEMRAFVGILYYFGMVKMPSYKMYWSRDGISEMRGFRGIMSRNRWMAIWKCFHIVNNDDNPPRDDPNHDKIHKIRPIMEILIRNWQSLYNPAQELSVDESIIAFKGRTGMRVYMPGKPHKWGIKAWALCESRTGYLYNWDIYKGAGATTETGLTKNVVLQMVEPVVEHRHHIYMDNYFSSPELYAELAARGCGACGTLRINRNGVPARIKNTKLKKGDPPLFVKKKGNPDTLYVSWFDKKQVNVMTTIHTDKQVQKTVRVKDPANNNLRTVMKPACIELYNQYMGGVDLLDQKLEVYLSVHRTVKWWKKVLVYLFEASFVNSRILFNSFHPFDGVPADKFRQEIVKSLTAGYPGPNRDLLMPPRNLDETRLMVELGHYLALNPNKTPSGARAMPDCVVCSERPPAGKRHQCTLICKICQKPMCPYPCFERFHTMPRYRVKCTKELHFT
jgi:hypothetical protein